MTNFNKVVTATKIKDSPLQLYEDFVMNVCLDHLDIVQNSLKPSFCTYMGLYIVRYLKQAVID